jgi:transposase
MGKSKIKSMLICLFDSQGVIHKEFMPQGQTVNRQYYREVLERLRKRVHRVRPEIANTWMLHHDNALCHRAVSVDEFLTKKGSPVVPQPPYSPDLSPCDFLFPKLEFHLNDRILELWTTFKMSWQNIWEHFHIKTSSTATGSGSNVSGSVWLPKGTALKEIMLICR